MKYKLHQVYFTNEEYDHIDKVGRYNVPKKVFKLDLAVEDDIKELAKKGLELGYYSHVSNINTPYLSDDPSIYCPMTDLEDVFKIGNNIEINGYLPEQFIERLLPMHSISVGDIIENQKGELYVVASFGFEKLDADKEWFKKELLEHIAEQEKEINLFEKELNENEEFYHSIEFENEEQTQ